VDRGRGTSCHSHVRVLRQDHKSVHFTHVHFTTAIVWPPWCMGIWKGRRWPCAKTYSLAQHDRSAGYA